MKKTTAFIFLISLCLAVGCGRNEALSRVDNALRSADEVQARAMLAADSAASLLIGLEPPDSLFEAHLRIASVYASLDLETALEHIRSALDLSEREDCGRDAATRALLRLASLYNSQGAMVKDAAAIFDSLEPDSMSPDVRREYYILGVQINRSLADVSFDKKLSRTYRAIAASYRDSVMAVDGGSPIIAANRLVEEGKLPEAERILKNELPDLPSSDKGLAPLYHTLAGIYARRGMHDEALEALASAAVCDLGAGVREYKALPELAVALLALGDVRRAHLYIHRSAIDAAACHASQRQLEVAASLPAIDAAYARYQERRTLTVALISLCGLLVAAGIGIGFLTVRRKNRQLHESAACLIEARDRLERVNESMQSLNDELAAESRIKERYITAFMELCLSYLKKMESYRADLGKIAARGDWDALKRTIKSSRYVNHEVDQFFRQFDKAFLSLYPDFIHGLNALLRPEERYPETTTFTTELRIYALLRLGVGNSGDIAKFLRCSESTVYNYRTQMRNRALDRTSFEADFMAGNKPVSSCFN